MRPDRDEMLATIRKGLIEFVAPEVSSIHGRTELTYAITLLAALSRESDSAVADLVKENRELSRLLRSASRKLAGDSEAAELVRDIGAATSSAPGRDLRLSALRAENAKLMDLFVRLQAACEDAASPARRSLCAATVRFLKSRVQPGF
jgi:hypothetical protein